MRAPCSAACRRALSWVGAALVLGAVFWAYTRPGFIVTLVDGLWACF